jgi:hypothetical protein
MQDRPSYYRPETWTIVYGKLNLLTNAEMGRLASAAPGDEYVAGEEIGLERDRLLGYLLKRGSYLLCVLGFINNVDVMRGTVFSYSDVEYVLNLDNAHDLAEQSPHIYVRRLGEQKVHKFSFAELRRALLRSPDFDQLDR